MLRLYVRTVVHGRIIETDGAGHAVAELGRVLDVVHASDGVVTAEQIGGVVARITMPRRRIGRGRPTEGESGELDEAHFDCRITAAGRVQQVSVVAEVGSEVVRVERCAAQRIKLKISLAEGTNHAVFGGGAVSTVSAKRDRVEK